MASRTNLPANLTPSLPRPPSLLKGPSSLEKAKMLILESPKAPDLLSKVSLAQANEVLADLSRPFPICTQVQANDLAGQLIGLCPLDAALNVQTVTAGLQMLFAEYAFDVVRVVCHPTKGLPRRQKYGLKISDAEDALEREVAKRMGLYSAAAFIVKHHKEAAEQAAQVKAGVLG